MKNISEKGSSHPSYYEAHERVLNGEKYFSQACQDLFVVEMLDHKHGGCYIEIGGSDPCASNNTFLLEKTLGWTGFSIEYDPSLAKVYNEHRENMCFAADAITFDYAKQIEILKLPQQIDYLSVDIDPAENTFAALQKFPFDHYRCSVITYEHDLYASGPEFMELSRKFLIERGYQLVVSNVRSFGRDFEDWWVDPNIVPESIWGKYKDSEIEFDQIFLSAKS
ncbi:FkbM family methyltransferase [Pseudomonadales bacterium]|nr:FkbM family methyltransferase [Pseudomonadales bacterium]